MLEAKTENHITNWQSFRNIEHGSGRVTEKMRTKRGLAKQAEEIYGRNAEGKISLKR